MNYQIKISDSRDYRTEPLGTKQNIARNVLNVGLALMTGLPKWIDAGTLLGLYRDGKFIDHDTDLDIALIGNLPEKTADLFTAFGFRLIRRQTCGDMDVQTAFLHNESHIIFDIYHFHRQGEYWINESIEGRLSIPHFPVSVSDCLYDGDVSKNFPGDLEAYLGHRYGKNWRVPTTGKSHWRDDAKNLTAPGKRTLVDH